MIIDSHAHYAHPRFEVEAPYLLEQKDGYAVSRADRDGLLDEMQRNEIVGVIEPSIGLDGIEKQLALASKQKPRVWLALGVHPTRCIRTAWAKRKTLEKYTEENAPVAIGETGLDYHYPRHQQRRWRQKRWFVHQIKLADRLRLPLILHIRASDWDALRILRRYRARLHGGVVHCFTGDHLLAKQYVALGFAVGIGGKLLAKNEQAKALADTVRHIPLCHLLVETDAPFVLPDTEDLPLGKNQRKKLCNSSLILPSVIRRIAELRGEPYETVEEMLYQNTVRIFHLE